MTVRVIRVLEYTYPDMERYEEDSARWTLTLGQDQPMPRGPQMRSGVAFVDVESS